MSTATAFKFHRVFPFCKSEATAPISSGWDYVDFTGTDEGLAAAMQFFWNIETINITPSGTTNLGPASFTTSSICPSPSLTNLTFYGANGFICNESLTGGSIAVNRNNTPIARVCTFNQLGISVTYENTWRERYLFNLRISYDTYSSRWRLYYNFSCQLTILSLAVIVNPSNTGFSSGIVVNTGSFTIAGLPLLWEARRGPINTFTGTDLNVSVDYWTY